jgi:hypothetical protein
MQAEKEENAANREYTLRLKELDIEAQKLESRWAALLRLPITVIKLPVYIVFAIAYIVAVARKHEPSDSFWNFLK